MTTLLLLLLAAAALPLRRVGYDPFAPAGSGGTFPLNRLRRAGLDGDDINRLRATYEGMDAGERRELTRFVTRNPDSVIRSRYAGARTREELAEMTMDELEPLMKERNLHRDGRKADWIDRLVTSYEGGQPAQEPATAPEAAPGTPEAGTAPATSTGEERAPEAAPTAATPSPAAAAPTATTATTTPGAAPAAPDAAPAAATSTEEDQTSGR